MALLTKGSRFGSTENIQVHLALGFLLRFILIVYGEHHDETHAVKYTDVDYHVFTDAAREVTRGGSPFDRHTYRYTPLLAWILLPNVHFHFLFGKLLFAFCDCVATKLIYQILILEGQTKLLAMRCSFIWLYNPLVMAISTRGSAEAVVGVFVLTMVYLLKLRLPILTGFMLGLSVHFKLYPVMYSLPVYLCFSSDSQINSLWHRIWPSWLKIKVVLSAFSAFFTLTFISFAMYEEQYIEEAFLYHFTRIDTRHNFSVYFYLLYLSVDYHIPGLTLATFGPQIVLLIFISLRFGNRLDVSFGMFAQTVIFVTFNKVVTSQYFVWYLLLLPLIVPRLSLSWTKAFVLVSLWIGAQGSWLFPAYLLEFHAVNAFVPIWLESIAFFCCNVGVLIALISSYSPSILQQHHMTRKCR